MAVVSIITPNFNRADTIGETAQSIFNQVYTDWEWVIVDDGSSDDSINMLRAYVAKDSRVKFFIREREPKGACTCRNIAVENATGKYLLFLDTDDLLAPYCLQQRMEAIEEQPLWDYAIFPTLLFKKKPDDLRLLWNIEKDESEIDRLLRGDPLCQGTGTIWKRDSFLRIGAWNESLALWQDVELHLRAHLEGCRYGIRFDLKPDVFIRITDGSLSRNGFYSYPKQESRVKVLTDTVAKMANPHSLQQHMPAVRELTLELLFSSIKQRYFKMAKELLKFSAAQKLLTTSDTRRILFYLELEKWRITRFPGVKKVVCNILPSAPVTTANTLGKIPYEGVVDF